MAVIGLSIMGIVVLLGMVFHWRKEGIGMLIDFLRGFWWLLVSAVVVGSILVGLILLLSLVF